MGIFLPDQGETYLYFVTSKVTSDCLVDCLTQFWQTVYPRFSHVTTLLINQDNGPDSHSRRTQFIQRMVEFVDTFQMKLKVRPVPRGISERYNSAMRDIVSTLEIWRQQGEQIAIATVIDTWGSAPRPVGSKMAVTLDGRVAGSVSAGCVEGVVIEEASAVIRSGLPRLLSYGVSDQAAFDVGLACGGTIKVFVEPFTAYQGIIDLIKAKLEARELLAVVNVLDGPPEHINRKLLFFADGRLEGDLSLPDRLTEITNAAADKLPGEVGGMVSIGELSLFVDVYPRLPRLIIVGAVHIAEFLIPMARLAGFDITIVDPRTAFATSERFPDVEIVKAWPDQALASMRLDSASYVVVLTHDPKLDDPALRIALTGDARYVGALGSRRTDQLRRERLLAAGLSVTQLARLHTPIGLSIGSRGPAEIAISILAEIIQARNKDDYVIE